MRDNSHSVYLDDDATVLIFFTGVQILACRWYDACKRERLLRLYFRRWDCKPCLFDGNLTLLLTAKNFTGKSEGAATSRITSALTYHELNWRQTVLRTGKIDCGKTIDNAPLSNSSAWRYDGARKFWMHQYDEESFPHQLSQWILLKRVSWRSYRTIMTA